MKTYQILLFCCLSFWMIDQATAQAYTAGYEPKAYQDNGYAIVRQYPLQAYHQAQEPACLTCNHCQVTPIPIVLPNRLILLDTGRERNGLVEVNWSVISDEEVLEVHLYSTRDPEDEFSWQSGNHGSFDRYEYFPSFSGSIWYQIEVIHPNGSITWSQIVEVGPLDSYPKVLVYPNPGTGSCRIEVAGSNSSPVQIRLRDPQGRIVLEQQSSENVVDLDIPADFSAGLYLIEVIRQTDILREKWLRR